MQQFFERGGYSPSTLLHTRTTRSSFQDSRSGVAPVVRGYSWWCPLLSCKGLLSCCYANDYRQNGEEFQPARMTANPNDGFHHWIDRRLFSVADSWLAVCFTSWGHGASVLVLAWGRMFISCRIGRRGVAWKYGRAMCFFFNDDDEDDDGTVLVNNGDVIWTRWRTEVCSPFLRVIEDRDMEFDRVVEVVFLIRSTCSEFLREF